VTAKADSFVPSDFRLVMKEKLALPRNCREWQFALYGFMVFFSGDRMGLMYKTKWTSFQPDDLGLFVETPPDKHESVLFFFFFFLNGCP